MLKHLLDTFTSSGTAFQVLVRPNFLRYCLCLRGEGEKRHKGIPLPWKRVPDASFSALQWSWGHFSNRTLGRPVLSANQRKNEELRLSTIDSRESVLHVHANTCWIKARHRRDGWLASFTDMRDIPKERARKRVCVRAKDTAYVPFPAHYPASRENRWQSR